MTEPRVPPALLALVRRDLRPVRPLASPGRRALSLLPLGAALLVGIPAFWRWQSDLGALAPWSSWARSTLETAAGLAALAAGFREAIPSRELSRRTLAAVLGLVALCVLVGNWSHAAPEATAVPLATTLRWIRECVTRTMAFSVPALTVVTWLVARALPGRAAWTGALCGLGVGVMADAGLRLMCWDGDLPHVVLAHGGAIALVTAAGALAAWRVERIRYRLARDSS